MAELLIKAVSHTHPDPIKNVRGCYKRGDIVVIKENGHQWGREELLAPASGGKFVVIRISDVTVAQVHNFIQNKWGFRADDPERDENQATTRRRRLGLDPQLLPAGARNTLNTTGFYETTWPAVRAFVIDKVTGESAA
jgi:hypothetical protein